MQPDIDIIDAEERLDDVRQLLTEYVNWIGVPLEFGDFDTELAELPGQYERPRGRLYIAQLDDELVGCVALQPSEIEEPDQSICEMKRLFVRTAHRGKGISRRLAQKAIAEAKDIGYTVMLADTFDFIERLVKLFNDLGFTETEAYCPSPHDNLRYFRLDLTQDQ
ncbi:MAG: GNAT family N-acetyltransferase [Christensenellales bacterium]|jgi:putative acetyltransferase